jgi:hypothetical protein
MVPVPESRDRHRRGKEQNGSLVCAPLTSGGSMGRTRQRSPHAPAAVAPATQACRASSPPNPDDGVADPAREGLRRSRRRVAEVDAVAREGPAPAASGRELGTARATPAELLRVAVAMPLGHARSEKPSSHRADNPPFPQAPMTTPNYLSPNRSKFLRILRPDQIWRQLHPIQTRYRTATWTISRTDGRPRPPGCCVVGQSHERVGERQCCV